MADRLTQLQDAVNRQAENLCNSIAVPPTGPNSAGNPMEGVSDDYAKLFASLIARTAKDIDVLIDSLPSDDLSGELQAASLRTLEKENQEAAKKLEAVVKRGEKLLEQIQTALHDIAQSQLETARLFSVDHS
ncbi:unnamed protein product [Notodromas monacha]|uniref:Mediator of RNA polymerase II transcription subunit 21 n=1 Tax=Notodromas monacha TaxID=399045 RepID=A0A7R9BQC3_9CRUS|nr:unnamed protein product [Notodromas monacha]CAG0919693.1 unnamed protein product [Notodromas monacha]